MCKRLRLQRHESLALREPTTAKLSNKKRRAGRSGPPIRPAGTSVVKEPDPGNPSGSGTLNPIHPPIDPAGGAIYFRWQEASRLIFQMTYAGAQKVFCPAGKTYWPRKRVYCRVNKPIGQKFMENPCRKGLRSPGKEAYPVSRSSRRREKRKDPERMTLPG